MKRAAFILLTAGAAFLAINLFTAHRRAAKKAAWEHAKAERAAELERLNARPALAPLVLPNPEPAAPPGSGTSAKTETATTPVETNAHPAKSSGTNQDLALLAANLFQPGRGKKTFQDPVARQALSLVGADPGAEEIWVEAINNPDLPPNERKDLIEDLNEEGFPDPKNLTADDLPLILSRIQLIEEQAPNAMDEVNAAAFLEAYKDLINMAARLMNQ